MPIYEYVCTECDEPIEAQATIAEKEKGLKVVCPKCGSKKTARAFGRFMVTGAARGKSGPSTCGPQAGPGCCG